MKVERNVYRDSTAIPRPLLFANLDQISQYGTVRMETTDLKETECVLRLSCASIWLRGDPALNCWATRGASTHRKLPGSSWSPLQFEREPDTPTR
jgi:hypothetical protein